MAITKTPYRQLNLTGAILNADINASAAIAYSKLNLTGAVADGDLATRYIKADGTRALTAAWDAGAFAGTFNSAIIGSAANTIAGGALTGGNLTLSSTSHATKGNIYFGSSSGGVNESTHVLTLNKPSQTGGLRMGTWPVANAYGFIGAAALTPSAANYSFLIDANGSANFNAINGQSVVFNIDNGAMATLQNSKWVFAVGTKVSIGAGFTMGALLQIAAGTATAGSAPLKFTSGTNLTVAVAGVMEYDGTNLFFTRSGTTRESVICSNAVNTVSPTSPNRTITVVIAGTTYYLAAKTTND